MEPPPKRFLSALRICVLAQVFFNALMVLLAFTLTPESLCCMPIWFFPGFFSLLFAIELLRRKVGWDRTLRALAYIIYLFQISFYLLFTFAFIFAFTEDPSQWRHGVPMLIGLAVTFATLICLSRFDTANPIPKPAPAPPAPPPEPEEIETSGDWDEGREKSKET